MTIYFDLDGPILDVSQRYVALHERLAREFGFAPMRGDRYWQCKRARCSEAAILAEIGAQVDLVKYQDRRMALIECWDSLLIDRCWPWTKAVLGELAANHALVMVTARANRELLLKQLDHLGLSDYFQSILSTPAGADVGSQKAAMISERLRAENRAADGGWMVGDTEADVEAGKKSNLNTAAVLCGIRDREHLAAAGPDHIVADIRDLLTLPPLKPYTA